MYYSRLAHMLLGLAVPLPAVTGIRRHRLLDDPEPGAPEELRHLTVSDIAERCGLTKQAAHRRLQLARASGDFSKVLAPKAGTTPAAPAAPRANAHNGLTATKEGTP